MADLPLVVVAVVVIDQRRSPLFDPQASPFIEPVQRDLRAHGGAIKACRQRNADGGLSASSQLQRVAGTIAEHHRQRTEGLDIAWRVAIFGDGAVVTRHQPRIGGRVDHPYFNTDRATPELAVAVGQAVGGQADHIQAIDGDRQWLSRLTAGQAVDRQQLQLGAHLLGLLAVG